MSVGLFVSPICKLILFFYETVTFFHRKKSVLLLISQLCLKCDWKFSCPTKLVLIFDALQSLWLIREGLNIGWFLVRLIKPH